MTRKLMGFILSFICMALLLCTVSCTTPAGRSTGEVVDDASITSQVKANLLADDDVSGLAVSVDTFQGEVVLSGAVETQAQRRKAEQIASRVGGVKRVKNLLKIK
jgi:hyperosmotically inducible periplasmic protein